MNEESLKKNCFNCGREIELEATKCDNCGTVFVNEASLLQKSDENLDNLKTASQMIWLYVGNIIFWSFILAFANGFIESCVSGILYTLKSNFSYHYVISSSIKHS